MRLTKLATVTAVAVCTATLAATPASAHGAPFTVTAGSAAAGTSVPITLVSGTFAMLDTTTNQNVSCTSTTLHGSVTAGPTSGQLGSVDAARSVFTNCTGPSGLRYAITGYGTWTVAVTDSSAGVSQVVLGNVRAHLVSLNAATCSWDFAAPTGTFTSSGTATTDPATIAGSYTNSTQKVAVPATNPGFLGLWNVRGSGTNTYCISPALFRKGDRFAFSVNWTVAADNAANSPVAVN